MTDTKETSGATEVLKRFERVRRITCLGEAMIELSFADPKSDNASMGVAGDVLNTAYYLRLFAEPQVQVDFASALGNDPFSSRVANFIEGAKIGTGAIIKHRARTVGLYAIATGALGERSFTYWRSASAASAMMDDDVLLDRIGCPDALFLSGITLAILPDKGRARLTNWVERYRSGGGLVVFDPNYRSALWESRTEAQFWMRRIVEHSDLVLPSFEDEQDLWSDQSPRYTMDRLLAAGVPLGVIKDGARGPISFGMTSDLQDFTVVSSVVDTTGAGDSFNGRLLAELLKGTSSDDAVQRAHETACSVILVRGAIVPKEQLNEPR